MLLSMSSVLVVAVCFLAALLITLYLLFLRINRASSPEPVIQASSIDQVIGAGERSESGGKSEAGAGKKKKGNKKNGSLNGKKTASSASNANATKSEPEELQQEQQEQEETDSVSASSSSSNSSEEDDILMLAQLKGYNVDGLRKRSPALTSSKPKAAAINKPVFTAYQPVKPVNVSSSSSANQASAQATATAASASVVSSIQSSSSSDSLSSLTAEELAFIANEAVQAVEAVEVLEEVLEAAIETEAEIVEAVVVETVKPIEPVKPVETVKTTPIAKPFAVAKAQASQNEWSSVPTREEEAIKSLKTKLADLQDQLAASDASLVTQERALEAARRRSQLMEQEAKDSRRMLLEQKRTSEAQMTALKACNAELTSKLARMEAIVMGEAKALQSEAEEAKRSAAQLESQLMKATGEARRFEEAQKASAAEAARLAAELEEARRELQLARLHQRSSDDLEALNTQLQAVKNQNAQLSEEAALLQKTLEESKDHASKVEAALKRELEHHRAEQANTAGASAALHQEIATLKEELERATAAANASVNASASGEDELKLQLAEAEEKIAALQADLAREIKRADVAKKVYEAKLAELQN